MATEEVRANPNGQTEDAVPQKPVLVSLQPISDSLVRPFKTLFQDLYQSYPNSITEPVIENDFLKHTLDSIIAESALHDEAVKIYQKIVLEVVILGLLSAIIKDSYDDESLNYDELNRKLFILLDISIYATAISQASDLDLPFVLIHNIILKNNKTYILEYFQKTFFASSSKQRREHLIHNCGVTSASKRPGTEILEIYNDVTKIYDLQNILHSKFIGHLRLFVSSCFKIDEMVLNNPDYSISKHMGLDKDVYNSVKRSRATPFSLYLKVRYQLTYPETMFTDRWIPRDCSNAIFDLVNAIFDEDLATNDYRSSQGSVFELPQKINNKLEITQLKELAKTFNFSPVFNINEELFTASFKNKMFRQYIICQIFMMVNHVTSYWESSAFAKSFTVRADMRKTKDFCLSVKKTIQGHYKKLDEQFFFTINTISLESNKFWIEWKASNFKVTKETAIDVEDIKKVEELIVKNSRVRGKHIPKYGTNEISRIWKLETGLKNLNQSKSLGTENFEKLRDELQKLKNTLDFIEEDPDMYTESEIADLKRKTEMLTFKALRLHRENGKWLSFSNTNYKLGVEGLFDSSMITRFKEEKKAADKERLEKDKEMKDKEGDVIMDVHPVKEEEVNYADSKLLEDEDLDY